MIKEKDLSNIGYVELKRIIPICKGLFETFKERHYNNGEIEKIDYKIENFIEYPGSPWK